jgi:siroheme synthase-like protein
MSKTIVKKDNQLFPVFLKIENLKVLIIGGGNVAYEKLNTIIQNCPGTRIHLVGTTVNEKIYQLAGEFLNIKIDERAYLPDDIETCDIVIAGVNDIATAEQIRNDAHQKSKLVNIADKAELCDFYLSSIVKKGDLKIAISTNGKSPTVAKRLKEQLNDLLPDEIDNVLENMHIIRQDLKGNFTDKVKHLNNITSVLAAKNINEAIPTKSATKKWQKIVGWCLLAFFFMILGHAILSFIPFHELIKSFKSVPEYVEIKTFLIMFITGFLAQMVDGSMGMGYGTISTTFLLAYGVNPAIVSSRVHSARVFSSGVSGYSHHRFGNINKKLFKTLVIPGICGAVIGATLAFFAQKYSQYVRVPLSIYTIYLGIYILQKAYKKKTYNSAKIKKAGWLAVVGGFTDSFAGGGWGTLVTSSLISKRKSPRYVIGSVCLAEFFVVLCSSVTFFILLKSLPFFDIAGLIAGGLLAAPIAARWVGKIPVKKMFIIIGILVIITSSLTLWRVIAQLVH